MTALWVAPQAFTVVNSNSATTAPASNANIDTPSRVWRSANLTTVYVILDMGASPATYDTISLIGTNLRATDTVQIQTGATNTGVGAYNGGAIAAYSQAKPALSTAKSIYQIGARADRYIRIDITSTGNTDTYVQVQRIVVGKAVSNVLDVDVEMGFTDPSVAYTGPNWESYDVYATRLTWKATSSWISEALWRSDWIPFLQFVGQSRAFLFTPDVESANHQTDACFGRMTQAATPGKHPAYNLWSCEIKMMALAP